jgi:hypothetical protein
MCSLLHRGEQTLRGSIEEPMMTDKAYFDDPFQYSNGLPRNPLASGGSVSVSRANVKKTSKGARVHSARRLKRFEGKEQTSEVSVSYQ